jgi:two-component system KDP operon response regulator KdpE
MRMSERGPLLLIVDDEPQLCRYLRTVLTHQKYRVLEAGTAREGESLAASHKPDLILLDLGLPDMDGILLTKKLRDWYGGPIIVISARGQEGDKIQALDFGANDYLTKPFGTGELLARIRVALRQNRFESSGANEPLFAWANVHVNMAAREVQRDGVVVHLTPNEFSLLAVLIRHAGKVLTHRMLLHEVWGGQPGAQPHYLRVYMAQLRHKLEEDPAQPRHLLTELGVGYRLKVD